MGASLAELRELSHPELVNLVADLWEVRPGWRTIIVEPGDEVEIELDGESLNFTMFGHEYPPTPDVDVFAGILAVQEFPYGKLLEVGVHADDDEITKRDLMTFPDSGHRISESIMVTTGTGPDQTLEEQFYGGCPLIEGEDLCGLIDQYTEFGFDYEAHL